MLVENFIFNFRIYQIFSYLLSFANFSSTEFMFAFSFFSHTISKISRNISNVLFSCCLKRLNAFSHYQNIALIGNTQNLSSGFIYQSCVVARHKHSTLIDWLIFTGEKFDWLIGLNFM